MWFIGFEVEQEASAPPPKKNPGSAPGLKAVQCRYVLNETPITNKLTVLWNAISKLILFYSNSIDKNLT